MANYARLAKILCILAASVSTHVSWAAPAQSGKAEQLPPSDLAERFLNAAVPHVWLIRATWWTIGFAEIATILLQEFAPSFPFTPPVTTGARVLGMDATSVLGLVLIVLGARLRFTCYKVLAEHFTFELSVRSKHRLIQNGPYSIVRHPSYTGYLLVYLGLILWHGSNVSWVRTSGILQNTGATVFLGCFAMFLLVILYCLMGRIEKEDKKLEEVFGKEWEEYRKRVPSALLPGVL